MAKEDTQFKKGNRGRPKGAVSWKTQALKLIGEVYKDREVEAENYLRSLPIERLYKEFILPFLPKNIELTGENGGPIETFQIHPDIEKMTIEQRKKYIAFTESMGLAVGQDS